MSATGLTTGLTDNENNSHVKISSLNPEVNPVPNCHRFPKSYPVPIHEGMGGTLFPGNFVKYAAQNSALNNNPQNLT